MKVLLTGAAGFIGMSTDAAPAGARRRGARCRQPERLLRRPAQARPLAAACRPMRGFRLREDRRRRPRRDGRAVRQRSASSGWSTSRRRRACATRCRTRTPTSTATSSASSTSSKAAATSGSSTWSTHRARACTAATRACRSREHDNVDHPVSLYAATKKANELMAHTYSHLYRLADHRAAVLHRLRPVGSARHGAVPVHQGDPRRPADRRLQPRPDAARLHLHRRHRRRRSSACSTGLPHPTRTTGRSARSRRPATRRIACSTSAITRRCRCSSSSPASKRALGKTASKRHAAAAGRRRAGDLRRHAGAARLGGLRPGDARRRTASRSFVSWYRDYYKV